MHAEHACSATLQICSSTSVGSPGSGSTALVTMALLTMALLTAGAADAISMKLAGPGMPPSLAAAVSSYLDLLEKHRRIAAAAARELEGMEGLGAR